MQQQHPIKQIKMSPAAPQKLQWRFSLASCWQQNTSQHFLKINNFFPFFHSTRKSILLLKGWSHLINCSLTLQYRYRTLFPCNRSECTKRTRLLFRIHPGTCSIFYISSAPMASFKCKSPCLLPRLLFVSGKDGEEKEEYWFVEHSINFVYLLWSVSPRDKNKFSLIFRDPFENNSINS